MWVQYITVAPLSLLISKKSAPYDDVTGLRLGREIYTRTNRGDTSAVSLNGSERCQTDLDGDEWLYCRRSLELDRKGRFVIDDYICSILYVSNIPFGIRSIYTRTFRKDQA
jgi:hypothetical protein